MAIKVRIQAASDGEHPAGNICKSVSNMSLSISKSMLKMSIIKSMLSMSMSKLEEHQDELENVLEGVASSGHE